MIEFLTYDLKVAALIAIFYMFYRLMLARETFHRVNRLVLLLTAVASLVLPLCVITMHETVTMQMPAIDDMAYDMPVPVVANSTPQTPWWHIAATIAFVVGMLVTLGHTLWSLFRIMTLIRKSEKHPQDDGIIICVVDHAELSPFSWMRFIVMNRSDYEEQNAAILTHERGHIRLHHSWDLLLVDTLTALQWFNPAIWMLRSDLRAIHEYEADGAVLSKGINARQYQYLLITKAASIGGYSLANGISHSVLKNRINMMLHKKSNPARMWKLLMLAPIVAVTLAVNAETVTDVVYDEPLTQQSLKKGKKAGTIKVGNQTIKVEKATDEKVVATDNVFDVIEEPEVNPAKVYDVVEEMPQFPGGLGKLFEYLSASVKYPADAEDAGIQGRVIVSFVVEKDGSVSGAKVAKSIYPSLDVEALRVVSGMSEWIPGKHNGEPVRVKYVIPVTFKLKDTAPLDESAEKEVKVQPEAHVAGGLKSKLKVRKIMVDGKDVTEDIFNKLDPKQIESMEIVKGNVAVERYGEEAREGAILINTKKK